jgi:hypothetical protein
MLMSGASPLTVTGFRHSARRHLQVHDDVWPTSSSTPARCAVLKP